MSNAALSIARSGGSGRRRFGLRDGAL